MENSAYDVIDTWNIERRFDFMEQNIDVIRHIIFEYSTTQLFKNTKYLQGDAANMEISMSEKPHQMIKMIDSFEYQYQPYVQ